MATYDINLEIKHRRITRPILDQIVGTHIRKGGEELIIRCLSATKTVYQAVEEYKAKNIRITIVARDTTPYES
ncbi:MULTISPECIES: hypothetical protein [Cyanophyceae]|uniref:hypothetical protein n=1 Tax=Cyanophyceae TaxID=3028117 RepID=UPI001687F465|nr:hypothetical protein [Trichocoleus sp. FACHB-40]MBD2001965.1 hypothetical protein [Trichocoleus sp. FACHB-40]